ncbi:transient receptor potential cation channel subfamily A member 1 homolog [Planococcus citri]|uniref:transient receptor potential cation channel subfamily A member 1 homolog n=1 Tax=Planococcus citri TaxID=170843 RepID=UPI0031FA3565
MPRIELDDLEANSYPHSLQSTLLFLLKNNSIDQFIDVINNDSSTVNHFYLEDSENGTLLDLACRTPGNSQFVDILLQRGANQNVINSLTGKAPIHEAVQNSDAETLRVLLEDPNCNISFPDSNGTTALQYAALHNKVDLIDVLIQQGANKAEIENWPETRAASASIPISVTLQKRNSALNAFRKLKTLSSLDNDSEMYIKGDSIGEFIKKQYPKHAKEMQKSSALYTPIMKAARYGHYKTFERLWKYEGVSIEPIAGKTILHAVLDGIIAAKYKDCPARVFMENLVAGKRKRDSVNDAYFPPEPYSLYQDEKQDYYRLIEYILKNIPSNKLDINFSDESGNTALHYAVAWKETKVTKVLLHAGAYTCKPNKNGTIPLRSISAEMLEQYLDSCITSNDYPPEHSDFKLTFNYKMFLSPIKQFSQKSDKHNIEAGPRKVQYQTVRESEPILVMNKISRLRKLLIHPLIRSYLNLKWRIIKKYFYYNFILYFIYWSLLSSYLFYVFYPPEPLDSDSSPNSTSPSDNLSNITNFTINFQPVLRQYSQPVSNHSRNYSQPVSKHSQNRTQPVVSNGTEITGNFTNPDVNITISEYDPYQSMIDVPWRVMILVSCILLILREGFQAYVLPRSYLKSAENWLEMSLFVLTFVLITFYINSPWRSPLSATVILGSWMELILLMGRHPFFSTHVEMFKTVSLNFLKFLLLYSIMIIAFAFSFYILFKDKKDPDTNNPTVFQYFSVSVFKTLIMLTGEYDASTIPLGDSFNVAHIVFVLFLFLIAIVLFNLLSGLAVGDTQKIRNDAEIVGIVSRIKFIAYVETMAVGDPIQCLDFVDKLLLCFCCCFFWPREKKLNVSLEKVDDSTAIAYSNRKSLETFHKRISLSYRLRNSRIETFPNRSHFTWKSFDPQIIEDAVTILRKGKQMEEMSNDSECSRQVTEYKVKLRKMENLMYCKQITELNLLRTLTKKFARSGGRKVRKRKRTRSGRRGSTKSIIFAPRSKDHLTPMRKVSRVSYSDFY